MTDNTFYILADAGDILACENGDRLLWATPPPPPLRRKGRPGEMRERGGRPDADRAGWGRYGRINPAFGIESHPLPPGPDR